MQKSLIGVDIGTSNIKAVAFALDGSPLAQASNPTPTHYPQPDWAHYEPQEIWNAIQASLLQLTQKLPADVLPAAIAFASMAEAAVPIDKKRIPTYPAIAWFDRRTAPQTEWWKEEIGQEETARITGLPVRHIFGITKLMWLRDNEPDAFRRTVRWLNMADYGAFCLCGAEATDYSLASRTMVLDLAKKQWSTELLDSVDITADILCELVPSGTLIGHVHDEAAAATGLPQGLPVVSGGHDHVCGSLALGITEPGDVFDSMGTAESLFVATERPTLKPEMTERGAAQGIHVVPDRGYAMGGIYFSGGCIDWVRKLLLSLGPSTPQQSYEVLLKLIEETPAGSGGIFFLPHLRMANPPVDDSYSRGAFIGLSSDADPGHLARAVLEGLAYEYHQAYESMVDSFKLTPKRILATGGGSRNRPFVSIKAALAGRPITIATVDEAVCLGAAMLAGVGAGIYQGFIDATDQVHYDTEVVEPDSDLHELYQERYRAVYLNLYPTLRELNHTISKNYIDS